MRGAYVTLGSPGTGKTTRLLELVRAERGRGVPMARMAILAFTRAARSEVQERLSAQRACRGQDDLQWVRTIHSAAYRLLERPPLLLSEKLARFAERYSYRLTDLQDLDVDDAPEAPTMRTEDDRALAVWQWGRNRLLAVEEALARCRVREIRQSHVLRFVARYEGFKQEQGLRDFTDLLELVLAERQRPDVDVAFIDEAQDLSPLQAAVCDMWFGGCERVYIAGDDDQAVYGFQGADAAWLQEAARDGEYEVLPQSHRVPARIHSLADRIISRNARRVPKVYRPMPAAGEIEQWEYKDVAHKLSPDIETFVLARNRIHLVPIAHALRERGMPYVVEGRRAYSPLADERLCRGVKAGLTLMEPDARIGAEDAAAFLRYVPSSRAGGLIPWGVKSRLQDAAECDWAGSLEDLRREFGLGELLDAVAERGALAVMTRIPARVRDYLAKLVRQYGELPEPRIRFNSIHGSKGRQASLVVVLPCMTRTTHEEYRRGGLEAREAENRVFYVAVTRTRDRLVVVRPWTRRAFDMPSLREVATA